MRADRVGLLSGQGRRRSRRPRQLLVEPDRDTHDDARRSDRPGRSARSALRLGRPSSRGTPRPSGMASHGIDRGRTGPAPDRGPGDRSHLLRRPRRCHQALAGLRKPVWPPPGDEQGLVVDGDGGLWLFGADGDISDLSQVDVSRISESQPGTPDAGCDAAGHCWRVVVRTLPAIEMSTDGGTTWSLDYRMTESDAESALTGVDASCGVAPSASAYGLAVLPEEFSDEVVVAVGHAGLLRRSRGGGWSQVPINDLPGPGPSPTAPVQTPAGSLTEVPPVLPPGSPEPESGTPDAPCPSPSRRTVTPDPANGGPTTYEVCP